jgi:hypothetical protein
LRRRKFRWDWCDVWRICGYRWFLSRWCRIWPRMFWWGAGPEYRCDVDYWWIGWYTWYIIPWRCREHRRQWF